MLTEPLPSTLDVRKAAAREVSISGVLKPLALPRFRALLAADDGTIEARLACSRDEEGRYLIEVAITATLTVTCQRCLEPMQVDLQTRNTLAVVWSDEQASHLPKQLEPLIVREEACPLWEVVEEELMLGLPAFNYHERADCNEELAGLNDPSAVPGEAQKPNPFDVLAQLKPGEKK